MKRVFLRFVSLGIFASVLLGMAAAPAQAAPLQKASVCPSAGSQTIDFSSHGEGPFKSNFFKRQGLVMTQGDFVGFIQGDQTLVGPVAGTFHPAFCSLSVRVAPAAQGTAAYTLTAYAASGRMVGSTTVTVTQDIGDPTSGPDGYFTIELTNLSPRAQTFTLENQFIRSSFAHITLIPFGVSSITYNTSH